MREVADLYVRAVTAYARDYPEPVVPGRVGDEARPITSLSTDEQDLYKSRTSLQRERDFGFLCGLRDALGFDPERLYRDVAGAREKIKSPNA